MRFSFVALSILSSLRRTRGNRSLPNPARHVNNINNAPTRLPAIQPAGPPRPPVALARVPIAKKPQRRYAWETLLPSFNFPPGFDEECGGGIAGMGGNAADGVNAEAPEAVAVTRAPFSAPPVYQVTKALPTRFLFVHFVVAVRAVVRVVFREPRSPGGFP